MKQLLIILFAVFQLSCATTTLYRNGEKIAVFQGDMTGVEYTMTADGDVSWKTTTTTHSAATLAQGKAASDKIAAAGAAIAISGIPGLFK